MFDFFTCLTFSGSVVTSFSEIICPKQWTIFCSKGLLMGFTLSPAALKNILQPLKELFNCLTYDIQVHKTGCSMQARENSFHQPLEGSWGIAQAKWQYTKLVARGHRVQLENATLSQSSGSILTCEYPLARSRTTQLPQGHPLCHQSTAARGRESFLVTLFSWWKCMQKCVGLPFFHTKTFNDAHSSWPGSGSRIVSKFPSFTSNMWPRNNHWQLYLEMTRNNNCLRASDTPWVWVNEFKQVRPLTTSTG